MKKLVLDIETDSLDYTKVWCVGVLKLPEKEYTVYKHPDRIPTERDKLAQAVCEAEEIVMHNGLGFDMHVLKDLCNIDIPVSKVFDTLVVSRLVDYRRLSSHSLEAWGEHLGYPKIKFDDFENGLTEEMLTYLKRDVEVTYKVYLRLVQDINSRGGLKVWRDSLRLERDIQYGLSQFTRDGFHFNTEHANRLLDDLTEKCNALEQQCQEDFPPQLQLVNRIKYKLTKGGQEFATVAKAREKYPKVEVTNDGEELLCFDWKEFNPGSTKDRIEVLHEAGWQPTEKTKGHLKWERDRNRDESKREHWLKYGWKVNEDNLSTLPEDAPKGALGLAKWLTYSGRKADLEEWLACVKTDGRIHGGFSGIGSWTHRLAHYNPNQANIYSEYHGPVNSAVRQIKAEYDGQLRALWDVPPEHYMVGTDAEGIQLRLLCHYTGSAKYREALISGRKEDETDIHNLNRKALGLPHITRDQAKRFIYSFLLGAGYGMVQNILECTMSEAKEAVGNFYASIDGLEDLKFNKIPAMWKKGYFEALDGRRIKPPSQHHMLAGMLQSGEAIVMKTAFLKWDRETTIWHKHLTWPHDEWQTEVKTEDDAKELGAQQCSAIEWAGNALKLYCPMSGETRFGKNWSETH